MDENLFFQLSIALTGEPDLNRKLADGLLARLRNGSEASALNRLAQTYLLIQAESSAQEDAIRERIMNAADLRELAKFIIVLWYTGELISSAPSDPTEEQYFSGILWKVARAHPPGISGGYFGHWTYPPDN